ncbi:hypothetical protein HYC85_021647 [Camellia sinensis]|uniref:Uncharacterized protein n=1 Tax=Camellia sinensis TaxID=4442 RepID=A0A7J7GI81_CAMSI|nr:hypothetical protein HYC85_021647 [Camellia sinensis]
MAAGDISRCVTAIENANTFATATATSADVSVAASGIIFLEDIVEPTVAKTKRKVEMNSARLVIDCSIILDEIHRESSSSFWRQFSVVSMVTKLLIHMQLHKTLVFRLVSRLMIEDSGAVNGVILADGTKVHSSVVLSNATPYKTFMDTGSPVGALVSQDVNRSDDLKRLYPEPSQCTCYVLEDVSLSELGNSLTEFLHIQDDKKLASSSNLVQPADKTDNFNVEKEDKCKDLDQTEPTTVTSEKFFPKCATFACSGKKASLAVSANVEDDINAAVLEKNGHESVNPACPQSISLPTPSKLVSAMKGSPEKQGMTPLEKLTVRWAPDVYDPPPSISTSTSGKIKKPRPKSESKRYYDYKNGKNKQKGKPSKGSSSKDKKHVRKHGGSSNKYYQTLDNDDRVVDYNEPCGESGGFGVGSPNSYYGSSFLKKSVRELHFSIAEAT